MTAACDLFEQQRSDRAEDATVMVVVNRVIVNRIDRMVVVLERLATASFEHMGPRFLAPSALCW
jgi:predicted NUDIX family phosphoesterase